MRFLTNEHALKVNGKPVIIFFSAYNIVEYLGGREKARECFDYLRDECVKAGLPGCFIMGCMGGQRGANGGTSLEKEQVWRDVGEKLYLDGFDAITGITIIGLRQHIRTDHSAICSHLTNLLRIMSLFGKVTAVLENCRTCPALPADGITDQMKIRKNLKASLVTLRTLPRFLFTSTFFAAVNSEAV